MALTNDCKHAALEELAHAGHPETHGDHGIMHGAAANDALYSPPAANDPHMGEPKPQKFVDLVGKKMKYADLVGSKRHHHRKTAELKTSDPKWLQYLRASTLGSPYTQQVAESLLIKDAANDPSIR
ncbi:MAG: hypothetical protein V4735_03285 [Pseudomonadota bacterium]